MVNVTENTDLERRVQILNEQFNGHSKENIQRETMDLMHKYNEIKDATQVVLGAIANIEGVTVKELHYQFQLPLKD